MQAPPTVRPGSIAFDLLSLIGQAWSEVMPVARWTAGEPPGPREPGVSRLVYRARGDEDGHPVPVWVVLHLVGGRVEALALATPSHVSEVDYTPEGKPYLVAVRRPPGSDPRVLSWVGRDGEQFVNYGLAY